MTPVLFYLAFELALAGAAGGQPPASKTAGSQPTSSNESGAVNLPGHQLPCYFAVSHFFFHLSSLREAGVEWTNPTPSPWQVHVLEPMGVAVGSQLEASLIESTRAAVQLLERSLAPGELDTSSSEAFERTQRQAIDRRARDLGTIFAGLLVEFENAGVAKSRLVGFITKKIRPDLSASSFTDKPSAQVRNEMQIMYSGFDEEVLDTFPSLDSTEVLP